MNSTPQFGDNDNGNSPWPAGALLAPYGVACVLLDEWARHWRAADAISTGIADAWLKSMAIQQDSAFRFHNRALYLFAVGGRYVPPPPPAMFLAIALAESCGLAASSLQGSLELWARSNSVLLDRLQEHYGNPIEYLADLQELLITEPLLEAEELLQSSQEMPHPGG